MWTLEQGLALARQLEPIAMQHNAHVALGGGVLHLGGSDKDLDLFIYPRKSAESFPVEVLLKAFGATNILHRNAGYSSDGDEKKVYVTKIDGKRVDFFFVK